MVSENYEERMPLIAALQWHLDHGADEMLLNEPVDRTKMPEKLSSLMVETKVSDSLKPAIQAPSKVLNFQDNSAQEDIMGAAEAIQEAKKLADGCHSLEELKLAIEGFTGLSVKKTASNIVFSDGNPEAPIMLIGEAPGAEEDIQGKPFAGQSGRLLDRILACIGLNRHAEELKKAVYISNILNWRPPGNRTPTASEMSICLPFIERHIMLAEPKILLLCGGLSAQTILKNSETISRLRGKMHSYQTLNEKPLPALVTYHPDYLLRTPLQKKAVWTDMLMFQDKLKDL